MSEEEKVEWLSAVDVALVLDDHESLTDRTDALNRRLLSYSLNRNLISEESEREVRNLLDCVAALLILEESYPDMLEQKLLGTDRNESIGMEIRRLLNLVREELFCSTD